MQMSRGLRVVMVAAGAFLILVGAFVWVWESEYGGWSAMEGYEFGYLADGSVEIRDVPWSSRQEEMSGSYEVREVDGGIFEVAFVDRGGQVMFTGSAAEVDAWLEEQGEQLYLGTYEGALDWESEQRSTGKSYVLPGILAGIGALVAILGMIPGRRTPEEERQTAGALR